jgi:SAM-dependent MidA family methyltransferase
VSDEPERLRGPIEVGLRRVPELDPDAPLPASDPRLVARLAEEIDADGPMTFARFMEIALYDPDAGYYTTSGEAPSTDAQGALTGPGRRGDFLTAPESHPIFGWALARHLESVWQALDRPARFVVREHGAGTGALAAGILDGLRRSGSHLLEAIRYVAIEASPRRLGQLRDRLDSLGLTDHLDTSDDPATGAILANELLDALPVHRVEGGPDGSLLERFVEQEPTTPGAVPAFTTVLGQPSSPALVARLAFEGIALQPGQSAEICLALDRWMDDAVRSLEQGELLVIDYGHPAAALYQPERGSTLRAYHRHRVHADPLVAIGRQDLTAHVDLTALERAAEAAGLQSLGQTTQGLFLAALETGELLVGLQSDPATTLESYLEARSALARMLDPRATGAFAVLAFGRGLESSAIRGFG